MVNETWLAGRWVTAAGFMAGALILALPLIVSAFAPAVAGSVARVHGYPAALSIASAAFVLAAVFWIFIPETKGRSLS